MNSFVTARLTIFFSLIFIIISCCSNTDLKIAPSLKAAWIPYQLQDQIPFIGEKGDTIILKANVRTYYPEATDQGCGPYRIQTEEVTFTTPIDPDFRLVVSLSHEIVLNLKAYSTKTNTTGLEAKFNTVSELYISHAWRDTYAKERTVNGRTYPNVLQVFGNSTPGLLSFSEIIYTQQKGLVGFKTFNGGWYFPD